MIRLSALALIAAAYFITCFLSPFGFWMKDAPAIEKVSELPDAAIPPDIRWKLESKGIKYAVNRPGLPLEASRLALGRQFRSFEALALPFAYYGDGEYVLYAESRKWLQVLPVDDAKLAELNGIAGRDLTAGFKLPWWKYVWGWLFVVAIGIWLTFQFAHEARMRRLENDGQDVL